ncbi:Uncharacterised protein [Mycobacteroides abscessus subsp. abscessus]|nr:Uncharacterised protein [Mycobacteroides abscessus subsp. abscessus]
MRLAYGRKSGVSFSTRSGRSGKLARRYSSAVCNTMSLAREADRCVAAHSLSMRGSG